MGASNFARGNASSIFAVLMNTEETFKECSECGKKHFDWEYNLDTLNECEDDCEDATFSEEQTEYRSCEEYDVDDLKEHIRYLAEEKQGIFRYEKENGSSNDNQYNANYLFNYSVSKSFGDIEVDCKITASMVGAYYEGASLDWDFEIYNGGEWSKVESGYTENDIIIDLFSVGYSDCYGSDMSSGLRTIQSKNATKFAEKTKTEMVDLIETVFEQVSNPLQVVATFSNGETVYQSKN